MPNQLSEKPQTTIRDLLVNNWVPGNTASYDPTLPSSDSNSLPVHDGNYESTLGDPQISITHPSGELNTIPGMDPGGGGAQWIREGEPIVQCWAEADATYNNGNDAEAIVRLLRLECERVIHANNTGSGELFRLFPVWDGRFPDPEDYSSPMWQSQLRVNYTWLKTP